MAQQNKDKLLDPKGPPSILNICHPKPKIGNFPQPSDALARVKNFLPQLKKAEEDLKNQMESGQNVDIEDIEEDEKHIEMNVELWSEDSDPDSPPSPAERDNAYTSDSDSSSSSSVSSSSSSQISLKLPKNQDKRPSIQELN